jgi:hypothetical protein
MMWFLFMDCRHWHEFCVVLLGVMFHCTTSLPILSSSVVGPQHLCNFSVVIVFILAISMAFVFFLHYGDSYILIVLCHGFFLFLYNLLGGFNLCVFCVVYKFLVL